MDIRKPSENILESVHNEKKPKNQGRTNQMTKPLKRLLASSIRRSPWILDQLPETLKTDQDEKKSKNHGKTHKLGKPSKILQNLMVLSHYGYPRSFGKHIRRLPSR